MDEVAAAARYSQQERLLSLETSLGPDVLLCRAMRGEEALSRPFVLHLDLLGTRDDIKPGEIVGANVTVSLRLADGTHRPFNGFVRQFRGGALETRDLRRYTAEVVPWLWFLTLNATCRFFQDKTVPQILEAVFRERGFSDFDTANLRGPHPVAEYRVQYRETDFDFVSRLMEERGIFYSFRHERGRHTLVLADHKGAYQDCPERELAFTPGSLTEDHLDGWEHRFEFRSGRWAQNDYNFETPSASLLTSARTLVSLPRVDRYEIYDYPGTYPGKDDGQTLTRIRMEELEAGHEVIDATGRARTLFPGGRFRLRRHDCATEEGKDYLVTAIEHDARDESYLGHGTEGTGAQYRMRMSCIPAGLPFRPPRLTPKPAIHGVQTAVVVGPEGNEIHTDKYGRIQVRFHWDRDARHSCAIRVAQAWAGSGWGAWFVPRIGQEVVVAFLEGDPDRPVVIGSVHNASLMPPYGTPGSANRSGMRSRSTTGGGGSNYNEVMLDDTKGSEQVSIRAEKDQNINVGNDETHGVKQDRSKTVGRHETTHVGGNRTETVSLDEAVTVSQNRKHTVGMNETTGVGANRTATVGGDETISISGSRTKTVAGSETVGITGGRTESVKGPEGVTVMGGRAHTVMINEALTVLGLREVTVAAAETTSVAGGRTVTVGGSHKVGVGGSQSVTVGGNDELGVTGNRSENVKGAAKLVVGRSLSIQAEDTISIKVGSATITMNKNGDIAINGKHLSMAGSGKIKIEASNNVIVKGQKVLQN